MELEKLHSAYVLRRELASYATSAYSLSNAQKQVNDQSNSQDATNLDLAPEASSTKLYRHIQDTYDGKGYLSKDIGYKLSREASNTFNILSHDNPKASGLYSAYLTANFSYGAQARFVKNISGAAQTSADIRKAYSSK